MREGAWSLIFRTDEADTLFVLKMAREQDCPQELNNEAVWMHHLGSKKHAYNIDFAVPRPISIKGSYIFRIEQKIGFLLEWLLVPAGWARE
ncbi:MAG: hypothetical protein RBS57_06045 [Desulforhabdus sp.]|nr:hypothetical protein [Desulforhabdus sp.]